MKSIYSRKYQLLIGALKRLRVAQGVTQEGLAKRLRRPQSFVSKFEHAERRLDVAEYWEVVEALGEEPVRLLQMVMGKPGQGTGSR